MAAWIATRTRADWVLLFFLFFLWLAGWRVVVGTFHAKGLEEGGARLYQPTSSGERTSTSHCPGTCVFVPL